MAGATYCSPGLLVREVPENTLAAFELALLGSPLLFVDQGIALTTNQPERLQM